MHARRGPHSECEAAPAPDRRRERVRKRQGIGPIRPPRGSGNRRGTWVTAWLERIGQRLRRAPDFVIEQPDGVYLRRWWLIPRNRVFNVYLHHFLRSDDDRALHDHPWAFNVSVLLKGHYHEHTLDGQIRRRCRWVPIIRRGKAPHRLELIDNRPVWTLFITGRNVREWGFYCPKGWKHWRDFVEVFPGGNGIGPGCDDTPPHKAPEGPEAGS